MGEPIITYKGTDKDMKCRGFQYELDKTAESDGAVRCGSKGLHSCEMPLDVLTYYKPDGKNRYFRAEADGEIAKGGEGEDSKIASSKLTLKAEVGIPGLVKAQVEWTKEKAESRSTDNEANAVTSGNWANAATSGDGANAATSGDEANAVTSGQNCISAALGRFSAAKAAKGSWIVLVGYDGDGNIATVQAAQIDGEVLKPDTWYTMKNGQMIETTADE